MEQATVEPLGAQDCLDSDPADLGPNLTPYSADSGLDSASTEPDPASRLTGNPDPALSARINGDLDVQGDREPSIEFLRSEELAGSVAAIEGEPSPELAQSQTLTQAAVNPPSHLDPGVKTGAEPLEEVILPESRNPSPDLARLLATIAPEALANDPIEATAADSGDRPFPPPQFSPLPSATSAPSTAASSPPTPELAPDSQDDNLLAQLG